MMGRFSMSKQVSTPSMSKKTGKAVKAQTPGMYPKAVVSRKVSSMNTPKMGMRKMGMLKMGTPKMKKGF
jgi:hypothetical protein